jgi:glycine cleavage system H lipoate-binding protein
MYFSLESRLVVYNLHLISELKPHPGPFHLDNPYKKGDPMHSALNRSGSLVSSKVSHRTRQALRNQRANQPSHQETCRHYPLGPKGPQGCLNEGACGDCPFDEVITAVRSRYDANLHGALISVEGFSLLSGAYLHPGHMWLQCHNRSEGLVGLDQFASSLIGPPDDIEMPENGSLVQKGQPLVTVTRQGKSAHLLAPISGMVTKVNTYLDPRRPLQRREGVPNTWLVSLHTNRMRQSLKDLICGQRLRAFMQREVQRLFSDIEAVAGPIAADGGHLGEDIYGSLPELGWEQLAARYLRN